MLPSCKSTRKRTPAARTLDFIVSNQRSSAQISCPDALDKLKQEQHAIPSQQITLKILVNLDNIERKLLRMEIVTPEMQLVEFLQKIPRKCATIYCTRNQNTATLLNR
jgi:hypothetical protein